MPLRQMIYGIFVIELKVRELISLQEMTHGIAVIELKVRELMPLNQITYILYCIN